MKKLVKYAVFCMFLVGAPLNEMALAASRSSLYDVSYRTHTLVVRDFYARPGSPDYLRLNYREWFNRNARDVLVYVHGIQSHSQWFNEAGDELAARGLSVYAVDRRGSGLSQGKRGHVDTPFQWFADLAQFIGFVRGKNPGKRVHLMGNSFGGRIVMTYAGAFPDTIDSLILETPTTHIQISIPPEEMIKLQSHTMKYFPTPLRDDLLTDNPGKLAFITHDSLGLRRVTANMYKMDMLINAGNLQPGSLRRLTMPVLMLVGTDDRIIDTPGVIVGVYDRLQARKKLVSYDGVEHFLLFGEKHPQMVNEIASWMMRVPSVARSSARAAMSLNSDSEDDAGDWIDEVRDEAARVGWSGAEIK